MFTDLAGDDGRTRVPLLDLLHLAALGRRHLLLGVEQAFEVHKGEVRHIDLWNLDVEVFTGNSLGRGHRYVSIGILPDDVDLSCDGLCGEGVVARNHHDADAGVLAAVHLKHIAPHEERGVRRVFEGGCGFECRSVWRAPNHVCRGMQ